MQGNNNSTNNQIPRIVTPDSPPLGNNDCLIKGMILNALLDKQPLKSRDIFNSIPYDNYNSFRVILSRFCSKKYRYIERIGNTKPYFYQLTDAGKIHAQNPFFFRDKYKLRQSKDRELFLFELLNDPAKLGYYCNNMDNIQLRTIVDIVKEYVPSNSAIRDFGDEGDNHQSVNDDKINYEDKYFSSLEEVKKLKSQVFNLQLKLNKKSSQIPKPTETKLPSASKDKRYDYLCSWEGKRLTSSFFEHELIPYHVLTRTVSKDRIGAWKKKLNIDDSENIGIFAKNISSTLLKESLYRRATDEEIKNAGFYLTKNRGIRILSEKYPSINKVVLKQSEIPTESSKNTPRSNIVIKNKN